MARYKEPMTYLSNEYTTVVKFFSEYSSKSRFEDNRRRPNIIIKHAFFVNCRELTSLSLADIGSILNKDHATVIHAEKKHEENMIYLRGYKEVYNDMRTKLERELNIENTSYEVNQIDDLMELRERLIQTSSKLRMKILEVNSLRKQIEESPTRAIEENKILSKLLKDVQKRNDRLHNELARLKNLV